MQVTSVTHPDGPRVYFEAVISPRRLTLRSFCVPSLMPDPNQVSGVRPPFLGQQAPAQWWGFSPTFFRGELLDQRCAGKILVHLGQAVLDLDDPNIAAEVSDHACWVFFARGVYLDAPYNRFAATSGSKVGIKAHGERIMKRRVLTIWQRFAGDSFDQMVFHQYHQQSAFFLGLPTAAPGTPQINRHPSLPALKLSGPSTVKSTESATINVGLVEQTGEPIVRDATVYLECVSGYVPKSRIKLTAGKGSFTALPLGLPPGDSLEVRAGFKFVSNLDSTRIAVT